MAVAIPLKLVYTPVDATVTAIRNYQVPSTTRTNESSNLISRTIVDYMIIGKQHWDSVRSCTIHRGSHLEIGSSPGNPTLEPCDHELITISIEIPGSPPNTSEPPEKRPERLQFHTDKLKEKPTLEKFQHALEISSMHALGRMEDTLAQSSAANIDRETLINTLHGIFTQNLQKVATSTLGKLKNHPPHHKNTEDEHLPQPQSRQPDSDPPAVKSLKQEISDIQKQIRIASQAGHPTATIDQMYLQLKSLRIQLHDKTNQHQDQQLHTYLNRGHLHFTLRGPTLNAAWRFFQTLAKKIKRKPGGLPQYTLYNKLGKSDPLFGRPQTTRRRPLTSAHLGGNSTVLH